MGLFSKLFGSGKSTKDSFSRNACYECGAKLITAEEYKRLTGMGGGLMVHRGSIVDALDLPRGRSSHGSVGYVCLECGTPFCMPCMIDKASPHRSGDGKGCLKCGGKMTNM